MPNMTQGPGAAIPAVQPAGAAEEAERFRDPSSGAIMRVRVDPADDSRHYVPDGVEDAG
jgi:hypothetical protein